MKSRLARAQTFSSNNSSTFKNKLGKSDENKDLGAQENKEDDFFYEFNGNNLKMAKSHSGERLRNKNDAPIKPSILKNANKTATSMTPNNDVSATTGSYTLKGPFSPKDINHVKKKLKVNEEDIVREEAQLEEA